MSKEYTYDIGKYTIGVDENGEDNIGLTVAMIENNEIKFLGNCYGDNARCIDLLIRENKELKKQLEEVEFIVGLRQKRNLISKFDKEYDEEDKKKNPNRDYAGIMPDAEEIYRRYYTMKNQQKEFIEYLNSYINLLNDNPDMFEEAQKDVLEEVLSKYKEIIGDEE